jgi:hypothetical protein
LLVVVIGVDVIEAVLVAMLVFEVDDVLLVVEPRLVDDDVVA